MKIEIDRSLLKFQLRTLLTDKTSLFTLVFGHWCLTGIVFGKKGIAALSAADGLLWTNYGLFVGTSVAVVMGAICVGFTLVKPRTYGMVELLLASPLSLRKLVATSFVTCFAFSAVNLAAHFLIIRLKFGAVPYGTGFYLALAAALSFTAFGLLGSALMSLCRKDFEQTHVIMTAAGILLIAAPMFTKLRLEIAPWLPPALAAAFLLGCAALWFYFHKLITREKAALA